MEIQRKKPVIGFGAVLGEDEAFCYPTGCSTMRKLGNEDRRHLTIGDEIRDWQMSSSQEVIFPYTDAIELKFVPAQMHALWPMRTILGSRPDFGGQTYLASGRPWLEYHQIPIDRNRTNQLIVFGFVATHNHFVLNRESRLFNRSSPLIKLRPGSTIDVHLSLLGALNSSLACFWMKQIFHNKGSTVDEHGARQRTAAFEDFYEHDGGKLAAFPITEKKPLQLAKELDRLAQELKSHTPVIALTASASHTRAALAAVKQRWTETLQRMIALQEELDWECYQLYGLTEAKLVLPPDQVPRLQLGERAFEIVMARKLAAGELQTTWFERHGSTPIAELPTHWPQLYRELVQRRIDLMESDRNIALIEQPEYKRRWNVEPWDEQLERALREWLFNRLEGYFFGGERMIERGTGNVEGGTPDGLAAIRAHWPAGQQPALVSTNQLAAVVETDADFLRVAEIYSGGPGFSIPTLVRELVEAESVPFLPFQRYKDTGLRKRQDWEHVWDLQRTEDKFDAQIEPLKKELETAKKNYSRDQENNEVAMKWIRLERELEEKIKALEAQKKNEVGVIPVPPKYASGDFKKSHWWKLRGKLDVPKERWIIYPAAERDADPSPVIAWAGWDHAQQAQALAAYYIDAAQNQGWSPEKLRPLLAGLAELQPWLKQWHNVFNLDFSSGLGDYFASFLDEEARKQGTTVEALNRLRLGFQPEK